MIPETAAGGEIPPLLPVNRVWLKKTNVGSDAIRANVKAALRRKGIPELTIATRRTNQPLAIVGGGASLKETIRQIGNMPVMVANNAHDMVVSHGITPEWCAILDGQRKAVRNVTPQAETKYLIASQCHPHVFSHLSGYRRIMWHAVGNGADDLFGNRMAVPGGSSVGLRCINLAILLGYWDLHFFGFDACYGPNGEDHAYKGTIPKNDVDIWCNGRKFRTSSIWVAQAQDFMDMWRLHGDKFRPTIHGDGLIATAVNAVYSSLKGNPNGNP